MHNSTFYIKHEIVGLRKEVAHLREERDKLREERDELLKENEKLRKELDIAEAAAVMMTAAFVVAVSEKEG